jgi:hypothetical protein
MIFIAILLVLSLAANVALGVFGARLVKRCFQFEDVFQFLVDDIEINLKQFNRMAHSMVLGNDAEIRAAHKNMMVMNQRLSEILTRMEEAGGRPLRSLPPRPRPQIVD